MAKKHKTKHNVATISAGETRSRVQKALSEGRTQTALDLARNLFKQDRSPENLQLLQQATLERARQLRSEGQTRDASTLLNNALEMGDATFLQQVAEELARCGQGKQALELLEGAQPNGQRTQLLASAVDAALRERPAGRKNLPDELHAHFDKVVQAFDHLEAGRDEETRACLQDIGLTSPFLEWKLLLRGLLAFYANDDARALDNWSRLDHTRVPARLAAPFRYQIDLPFRDAQPPAAQIKLRDVVEKMSGPSLAASLRKIQACLSAENRVGEAFRMMDLLMPVVKQQAPQLLPRLANCFYWGVIKNGVPDDIDRYKRVFGAPPHDSTLLRMEALALEERRMIQEANESWQLFGEAIEPNSAWKDASEVSKARALIWWRMGDNGAMHAPENRLPEFFRGLLPQLGEQIQPAPETCYRTSLKLDPDLLEAHEALFHYLRDIRKFDEALHAGHKLIKRFPNHVATLEELGDVYMAEHDYSKALGLLKQALQHNPLEKRLRGKVTAACVACGRELATAGEFVEARQHLASALEMAEARSKVAVLSVLAACEYKAGAIDRGDALVEQASKLVAESIDLAFNLAVEAARAKLPTKVRSRFTKAFTEQLAAPATAAGTAALLNTLADLHQAKADYYGAKSHVTKIVRYAESAAKLAFSEPELESICESLLTLKKKKTLRKFITLGTRRHPNNPAFILAEAEIAFGDGMAMWRMPGLFENARRLIDKLPPGQRKQDFVDRLQALENLLKLEALKRFPLESILNSMYDEDDDDEDEGYF